MRLKASLPFPPFDQSRLVVYFSVRIILFFEFSFELSSNFCVIFMRVLFWRSRKVFKTPLAVADSVAAPALESFLVAAAL